MQYNLTLREKFAQIGIAGEIDASNVEELWAVFDACLEASPRELRVNLAEVTHLDSAGLALLIFASDRLEGIGELVLLGASEEIARLLRLVGLTERRNVRIESA